MNKEELREKILNISNSCFPLIDFFNDIGRNKESRYDKEKAYEDIEKIYDVFMFYKEKCEKLEKVIEILKEHNLQVKYIPNITIPHLTLNDYGDGRGIFQEEYELLKEVLG